MKSINETAINLMKSLQNYIDNVENVKQVDQDDLDYSLELETVLSRFNYMDRTSELPCFNGKYDIDQESFDYYMKELAKQYNLKLIKDDYFPNDWIVSDGKKKHKCIVGVVESPNKIDGVNTNYIDIGLMSYSVQMKVYSFSGLDSILSKIKSGKLFKEFDDD